MEVPLSDRTMTLVEDLILGNWHGENQTNSGTKTECLLPVCGHTCPQCKPIPQQLLQLTESHAKGEIVTEKAPTEEHLRILRALDSDSESKKSAYRQDLLGLFFDIQPPAWLKEVILFLCASHGIVEYLKYIKERGIELAGKIFEHECALHWAAIGGHLAAVEWILQQEPNLLHFKKSNGENALHLAAHNGHWEVLNMLIDFGGEINAVNKDLATPLHLCAHTGKVECITVLVKYGASVNVKDKLNDTPLNRACVNGHFDAVKELLECGANPNTEGDTPLRKAIYHGYSECAKILLDFGAKIDIVSDRFITPLHLACFKGHVACVELLIERGIEVDARDDGGMTSLFFAAVNGHKNCMEVLINHGADVDARDVEGKTPLHTACRRGFTECVKLLVSRGADVNCVDAVGWSPLLDAVGENSLESVAYLLNNGADVNQPDEDLSTALHLAARCGYVECTRLLIKQGAIVDAADECFWTPLHEAINEGNIECAYLLLEAGANVNSQDVDLVTCLHKAAVNNDTISVALLLDRDARTDLRSESNHTAWKVAEISGSHDAAALIKIRMDELASNPDAHVIAPIENGNRIGDSDLLEKKKRIQKAKKRQKKKSKRKAMQQLEVQDLNVGGKIMSTLIFEENSLKSLEKIVPGFSFAIKEEDILENSTSPQNVDKEEEEIQPPPEFTVHRSEFMSQSELYQLDDVETLEQNSDPLPISEDTEKVVLRYQLEAAQQAILNMETELSSLKNHEEVLRKSFSQVSEKVELLEFRMEKVESKLQETIQSKLCKHCGQKDRNVVLMPCLHFLYCNQCARDWKVCLQCNSVVAGFLTLKM